MKHKPIRGVNLGGWLLAERWMTPSLFNATDAKDEYGLAGTHKGQVALRRHHREFIRESDFSWIAAHGLDAVRIPVGYWALEGAAPFVSCAVELDNAFEWSAAHGLRVLLSVHGAPGSQNGNDHSGQAGQVGWHLNEDNVARTTEFAAALAARYGNAPALLGIELLNEPDPKIPRHILAGYYADTLEQVRRFSTCAIAFSDGFDPSANQHLLTPADDVYIDSHQYQMFQDSQKDMDIASHLAHTAGQVTKQLRKMQHTHRVLVGEWSLALDAKSTDDLDEPTLQAAYRAYAKAQIEAYDTCDGWFFWTYKTEGSGPWNYRYAVEQGWLPVKYSP